MKHIIDFKNNTSDDDITLYLNQNNCTVIKIYSNFLKTYLVNSETDLPITDIIESVVNDDDIIISPLSETVTVNQFYHLPNPNYPTITLSTTDEKDWWKNYVLKDPDFENPTTDISRKGNGVTVYIMDSGIEGSHPEFSDSNIVNLFSIIDTFSDTNGHGTAIASVISGKSCGLSNATLKIVKIFDNTYPTRQSDMLNALDSILGDFSINNQQAAVLNCSWSIGKNQYIENKFRTMINQGICVVASAGNNGLPIENVTPASMPEVVTIGSYGPNFEPSNFSNYSNPSVISNTANEVNTGQLDGWAPGEEIWVAALDGGYGNCSGTSISAAIHSCVLAYNLTDRLFNNYNIPDIFQKPSIKTLAAFGLNRVDFMDLSNPKYSNSTNRISTLVNNWELTSNDIDYYEFGTQVGNKKILGQIYNPQITKNVEIINPLPEGFYIIPSGQIAGYSYGISGTHQIIKSLIRITNTDDISRDVTVVIAITTSEYDTTTVPADDPILQIILQANTCSQEWSCCAPAFPGCPPGFTYSCANDCESASCNNGFCPGKANRYQCGCN